MKLNDLVLHYLKPAGRTPYHGGGFPSAEPASPAPPSYDFHSATKDWPSDWRYLFEERSAIMEYEANLERAEAERLAYEDTRRLFH